jgi:hypothetical protein
MFGALLPGRLGFGLFKLGWPAMRGERPAWLDVFLVDCLMYGAWVRRRSLTAVVEEEVDDGH